MQHGDTNAIASLYPAYCFPASPTYNKWVKLTAADVHALRREAGFEGQNIYFHLNHPIRYVYLAGIVVEIECPNDKYIILKLDDGSGATIEVKITIATLALTSHQPTYRRTTTSSLDVDDKSTSDSSANEDDKKVQDNKLNPAHTTFLKTATYTTNTPYLIVHTNRSISTLTLSSHTITIGTPLKVKGTLTLFRSTLQLTLLRAEIIPILATEVAVWEEYISFCTTVLCHPWVLSPQEVTRLEGSEREKSDKKRATTKVEKQWRMRRAEKRREWEEKRHRHEERAEEMRMAEKEELDGNALDRSVWKPYTRGIEVKSAKAQVMQRPILHPRVRELGSRARDGSQAKNGRGLGSGAREQ